MKKLAAAPPTPKEEDEEATPSQKRKEEPPRTSPAIQDASKAPEKPQQPPLCSDGGKETLRSINKLHNDMMLSKKISNLSPE